MSLDAAAVRAKMAHTMPGETVRSVCPFCAAEHEKSFAMTRRTEKPHLIMFRCFRGNCASSPGYVVDREGASMVLLGDKTEPSAVPLADHPHCSRDFLEDIGARYSISPSYLKAQGVRYGDGEALCMPWLNENSRQIGWVEKRFDRAWHKSHHDLADRTAGRLAFPLIGRSYHTMQRRDVVILVESLVDAYRVNEYAGATGDDVTAVALLGADLSGEDALRLTTLFDRIMVLLDPDQWPKGTQRVMKRFSGMPMNVRGTTLPCDPKDACDAELETVFERCREMLCTRI